jgi:hypothetical protein
VDALMQSSGAVVLVIGFLALAIGVTLAMTARVNGR